MFTRIPVNNSFVFPPCVAFKYKGSKKTTRAKVFLRNHVIAVKVVVRVTFISGPCKASAVLWYKRIVDLPLNWYVMYLKATRAWHSRRVSTVLGNPCLARTTAKVHEFALSVPPLFSFLWYTNKQSTSLAGKSEHAQLY